MDKTYELEYHQEEEQNWWFAARRDVLHRLFKKLNISRDAKVLDIGCAGGIFLCELKENGYKNVYALDYSAEAIALCKARGIENAFQMDGHTPDFAPDFFDIIIASDSLEHLEHDTVALNNWHRILAPGGLCLVFVPAFQFLWSTFDETNFHFRRYTLRSLQEKLVAANFEMVRKGYWNFLVFFPTFLFRTLQKLKPKKSTNNYQSDIVRLPAWINRMLINVMRVENRISMSVRYPVGVSTFFIGKKPNQ